MRKFLLIIALVFCAIFASAQETTRVYCELYYHENIAGAKITVDFGAEEVHFNGGFTEIYDEKGNKFISKIAAVNYLCFRGWEVSEFMFALDGKRQTVVLYKDVTNKSQILEGININKQ
jgi:hypothetical protein